MDAILVVLGVVALGVLVAWWGFRSGDKLGTRYTTCKRCGEESLKSDWTSKIEYGEPYQIKGWFLSRTAWPTKSTWGCPRCGAEFTSEGVYDPHDPHAPGSND